jgi:hypothetical protein
MTASGGIVRTLPQTNRKRPAAFSQRGISDWIYTSSASQRDAELYNDRQAQLCDPDHAMNTGQAFGRTLGRMCWAAKVC